MPSHGKRRKYCIHRDRINSRLARKVKLQTKEKKLNLGCGYDHKEGWINADSFAQCNPDIILNIEEIPYPFSDNEFDHILLKHVLEHVGESYSKFKAIMKELYRITKNNGLIEIHVPHFTHDTFWSDPTHVRAFTPLTFTMMSKRKNDEWIKAKANYTMIAYDMEVNFELTDGRLVYDYYWAKKVQDGEISREALDRIAREKNNVIKEMQLTLKAIKPFEENLELNALSKI